MKIPATLKHKPVIVSQEYDKVDGRYANKSDAKGLSIGLAQWNDRGKVDVLDLAILICRTKAYMQEAYRYHKLYDEANPCVERIALQGGALDVSVCTDNPMLDEDIKTLRDALARDDELLAERLQRLAAILRDMGY